MIKLKRARTKAAIDEGFWGPRAKGLLFDLLRHWREGLKTSERPRLKFEPKWGVVKPQLFKEAFHKCAYCETPTTVVAYGDVEHYRPKSVYWWLAYVYDNYLASCMICNQRYKKDHFEISGQRLRGPEIKASHSDPELEALAQSFAPDPLEAAEVSAFEALHHQEGAYLPHPYFDDPETLLAYEVFDATYEVLVVAKESTEPAKARMAAIERQLGLNRPELKRLRYAQYKIYRLAHRVSHSEDIDAKSRLAARELLTSLSRDSSAYAGMIRYFLSLKTQPWERPPTSGSA